MTVACFHPRTPTKYSRRECDQYGAEPAGRPTKRAPPERPTFFNEARTNAVAVGIIRVGFLILDILDTFGDRSIAWTGGLIIPLTTKYGLIHWTVTPWFLTSSASAVEKVSTNALVPEYVASMGEGTIPLNEPIFNINPFFLALDEWRVAG